MTQHEAKSKVQSEVKSIFRANNWWGCVFMATGTGKSKIAVDLTVELLGSLRQLNAIREPRILLVVPTIKLKDKNWKEEFEKWSDNKTWLKVERSCYASLHTYEGQTFDFVILDEGHNTTEYNSQFFTENTVKRCLMMTATRPTDPIKVSIFKTLKLNPLYELSLDEAVRLGLVAPYEITVITMKLENTDRYIMGGKKSNPVAKTEKEQYAYLSQQLLFYPNSFGFIQRSQFVYNLKYKTLAAKNILDNLIPKHLRTLIFCGSKYQANDLCEHRFYSKPTPPKKLSDKKKPTILQQKKYDERLLRYQRDIKIYQGDDSYNKFHNKEINWLSCCMALNEGENIEDMDCAFIVQLNSNEKDFIQRLGRIVRFRDGHIGRIIVLCVEDSVDKSWVNKATANLKSANIRWIDIEDLRTGKETILFE